MKKNRAFTLIEILLVTGILSIIVSVVFFRVSEAKKTAEDVHMKAEAQQVSNAIAVYKNDNNGRVPLTVRGGGDPSQRTNTPHSEDDNTSDYIPTMQMLVDSGYLADIPTSPSGQSYTYAVSDDFQEAVFVASLNRGTNNSNSLLCVSSDGQSSSSLCSNTINSIINPGDENEPPPVENQYLALSGGSEQILLSPGLVYEITYTHGSVNARYGLNGSESGYAFETWFINYYDSISDSYLTINEENGWSCDVSYIYEGETSNCVSPNYEYIQITNYNLSTQTIRITGSLY